MLSKSAIVTAFAMVPGLLLTAGCSDDPKPTNAMGSGGTAEKMAGAGGDASMAGSTAGSVSGTAGTGGSGGATQATKSILEIASGDARFSTLVAAVQKAGLTDALKANGLTVFAPTNDAFGALLATLGKKSLDDLTAQQLKPILIYHVLGTKVDAAAATAIGSQNGTAQALGGVIIRQGTRPSPGPPPPNLAAWFRWRARCARQSD